MSPWALPALPSAAYQLLAIIAALHWKTGAPSSSGPWPPISLLKPMYGRDEGLYRALRSHAAQNYPEFEILFGVRSAGDPALEDIERLQCEFPAVPMRTIVVKTEAPNAKVGVLARLAAEASHSLLVVNDDDMEVPPGYFQAVASPFSDSHVGLVTCLYRAHGASLPARLEALGVATDFAPSVMVARLLGVTEFALGATLALRAEILSRIGGFEPIAAYLADDYELGRRVVAAGHRVVFAPVIVDTGLAGGSWRDVWRHQLRWARTIRVSRTPGYYGSFITHTTFWALVAFAASQWWIGIAALALRFVSAAIAGAAVLKDAQVKRWFYLLPLRDLLGFAIWAGGCFGSTVYWRGLKLRLASGGRIRP